MEVEIICKENIKPDSPTPPEMRCYKLSALDQLVPQFYVSMVFFYPQSQLGSSIPLSHRMHRLKMSLSETLTRFYPFAGKVKNDDEIDCNDEGAYFAEARVNLGLSDLLRQPDDKLIHRLVSSPDSNTIESESGCYLFMIQVNVFSCGGMAISTSISHKLADGHCYIVFLKAWIATYTRSSVVNPYPSFIAPSIFPPNPSSINISPPLLSESKSVTRRFVFNSSAVSILRTRATSGALVLPARKPTRVEVVSALLWKCIRSASRARHGFQRPSYLLPMVNIRKKSSPPLPDNTIGNIAWIAMAECMPDSNSDLHSMVGYVRKAIEDVNSDFVESIKGNDGSVKISEAVDHWGELWCTDGGVDFISHSSNFGAYQLDFGWGKPIWFYPCHEGHSNKIFLTETRWDNGIEAWVTLAEEDMAILQRDQEILSFSSLDPSPLQSPRANL